MMPLPFLLLILILASNAKQEEVVYNDAVDQCLDWFGDGDITYDDLGYCVVSWDQTEA